MARDYSNRGNSNRNKKSKQGGQNRSRPANRRKAPRKNARKKGGTPAWVWMGIGLCICFVVAVIVYLATRPTSHPGRGDKSVQIVLPKQAANEKQSKASEGGAESGQKTKTAKQSSEQSDQQHFVFYERFHDAKVVFPKYEDNTQSKAHTGNGGSSETATSEEHTETQETQPSTPSFQWPGIYVIQTGSFQTIENASQLKAKLTLLGLNARVVKHQLHSGATVYRVRTQTIDSKDRMTTVLKRLRGNGIATLVLRKSG